MGGAAGFSFSGRSVISASVVRIIAAMEAAFSSAERVTLAASITPASTISSVLFVEHIDSRCSCFSSLSARGEPSRRPPRRPGQRSRPVVRSGSSRARRRIWTPVAASPVASTLSSASTAFNSATPPPGTKPSSTAARVAESASSTRVLRNFSSTSVPAPTLIRPTPPESLARRSCSFSLS